MPFILKTADVAASAMKFFYFPMLICLEIMLKESLIKVDKYTNLKDG